MDNPFENREIMQIAIIAGSDGVGVVNTDGSTLGIVKIENHSLEFNDGLESIYWCLDKDDKIVKVIENCPVDVIYREKRRIIWKQK